jgi:hypothetical protein
VGLLRQTLPDLGQETIDRLGNVHGGLRARTQRSDQQGKEN